MTPGKQRQRFAVPRNADRQGPARRLPVYLFVLSSLVPGLAECGAEIAVISAAVSAASTGSAVIKHGKLDAAWMASFQEVVAAGEGAMNDLGLEIHSSLGKAENSHWTIIAFNEDHDRVTIRIARKTERLTEFQIDVGRLGKDPTARLILQRMATHLSKTNLPPNLAESPEQAADTAD